MIASVEECRDGEMQRGHAAGGANRADAVFQSGETLFEYGNRWIRDACIDVARTLQIEQRRGVIGILKDVGCGLIDRHRAGAGDRIWMLARMQAERVKCGRFWRCH